MTKRRTTQLLAQLKTLAESAMDNLYQRIGLASQVMSDLDWIASIFDGNDIKAYDTLTDEYFRDLGGYITLSKLIAMHNDVDESEWKALRYDIAAVEVVYDRKTKPTKEKGESVRTSWKKEYEKMVEKASELETQVSQLLDANSTLREENLELRASVARLEGRIEEMDRMLPRTVAGR